ncbi:ester cyclase [Maritalea sp.]|uniref:ester cyclase n=1 Tax=Maritalea sp. TaxID=2003361 RepID=UPI003EF2E897
MPGYQSEKSTILSLYKKMENHGIDAYCDALDELTPENYVWRGYHPFDELEGAQTVGDQFWRPLSNAMSNLTRRMDIFMAGTNMFADGEVWVCSMGHLMGLFDNQWLGIRPTGKLAMLRYCEFSRVSNGKIIETAMYFDIPHFMMQAGQNPFAPQTGAHLVQPGPAPHNGLMFEQQAPLEAEETLALINHMVGDLGQWQNKLPLEEELAQTWHDDMLWWGPAGVGATYTIERYAKQHSAPFRAAFTNRSKTKHVCRMAEGQFGGFFGWPNFTATHTGGFMGLPSSDKPAEFRVIDMYRRDGDKLAENWIFIDFLHMMKQMGVDVLSRNRTHQF